MRDIVIEQNYRAVPPRIVHSQATPGSVVDTRVEGQVISLAVDATSRGYDISGLPWNGIKAGKQGDVNCFHLYMEAEGNDVYFLFDQAAPSAANAIDDVTATIAAGTALSLTTSAPYPPARVPVGVSPIKVYVERLIDKTLVVKCASTKTATLRFWPCSDNLPGAT